MQAFCWEVLAEAQLGLCGLQVPTRFYIENKNTLLNLEIAPKPGAIFFAI